MTDTFTTTCCSDLGYGGDRVFTVGGNTFTDREIAAAATASYMRHRDELPQIPMGSSKRDYKRAVKERTRRAKELVAADVASQYGLDASQWMGIIGAIAAFLTGGPGALIISIIMAVVEWAITAELDKRFSEAEMQAAISARNE